MKHISDEPPAIANKASAALNSARCGVVELVQAQVEKYLEMQESTGQRIENKATVFFGLLCGTTAFAAEFILRDKDGSFYETLSLAAVFLASALLLFSALRVRRHQGPKLAVLYDAARVSCKDSNDLEAKWAQGAAPDALEHHEGDHRLAYGRFISEHLIEVADFNRPVVQKKARQLKWGMYAYFAEMCLILIILLIRRLH